MIRDVYEQLRRFRIPFGSESRMQRAVSDILSTVEMRFEREVSLSPQDRIDFLLESGIGIECKVAGSKNETLRQLMRYAMHDRVVGLILVTSRSAQIVNVDNLLQKPFLSLWVAGDL